MSLCSPPISSLVGLTSLLLVNVLPQDRAGVTQFLQEVIRVEGTQLSHHKPGRGQTVSMRQHMWVQSHPLQERTQGGITADPPG